MEDLPEPVLPKRPRSSYDIFLDAYFDDQDQEKKMNGDHVVDFDPNHLWGCMKAKDKEIYVRKSADEKIEYYKQMDAYRQRKVLNDNYMKARNQAAEANLIEAINKQPPAYDDTSEREIRARL